MVVGFAADGRASRVIGIDASAKPEATFDQIFRIAERTADLVELGRPITRDDVDPRRALRRSVLRNPIRGDERGDPPRGAARRHDDRSGLRRKIHAGHDRHDPPRGNPGRLARALRASRRRAGDQRLQFSLSERLGFHRKRGDSLPLAGRG